MSGMSIVNMTNASYLMYAMAGAFGALAIVLFFLFDITKCWKMVAREHFIHRKKQRVCRSVSLRKRTPTERLGVSPNKQSAYGPEAETVLLAYEERLAYHGQETEIYTGGQKD